ncbi:Tc toxin subunit A [Pseudomonas sp. UYIF39]|uniref:Tc toxin subunit A n=1 Tax=Pseudomonas sp. UYIF39 TaxID=1630747 RepID=UPI00249E3BF0|nr:Tc toxin subunit A [Pseudomonas sp. UYIF39]MDI3358398.1 Tc toxin subunit A [Pseudomonas sp. UYIF39]
MATSPNRSALQLFEQTFSQQEQRHGYASLATYLQDGGSIFPLVEQGVGGVMRTYGLTELDAKTFLEPANALAIYVRRQFIEHTLFGDPARAVGPQSGLLSMMEGPSFQKLFAVNFDKFCPPQALESVYSPVAYLIDLLDWIKTKIETVGTADKLPLHNRRKDLRELLIDSNAVYQPVSAVDIIVPVLETFITEHKPEMTDLEAALFQARYPNGLPYYQHWVSLNYVARHNGLSVGDVAHLVDLATPHFLQPHTLDSDAPRALFHASRLGPYQREMLTEAAHFTGDTGNQAEFYLRHFGALANEWCQYKNVPFFCERTKLDSLQLEALLSVGSFAPVRSANAPKGPTEPTPSPVSSTQSGSVYINAGAATSIGLEFVATETLHRLTNVTHGQIDRLNRKLRLDQWLGLPPEQVDALLAAAIKAETPTPTLYWITENSVQALGLFQTLRERYGCTAEDFAAFIHEVSFYGRGDTPSLFDRTFNSKGNYSDALQLDHLAFDLLPPAGTTETTINRLCSGLGIDLLTYGFLAQAIASGHNRTDGKLLRTPAVVSSFYRLVKLSRLLGITPIEGVLLLTVLGGETWLRAVAGVPRIQAHTENTPNVLVVIQALHACVGWCREHNLEVRWMLQQVTAPATSQKETTAEWQLFEPVRNLLTGTLFTNAELLMAGVPSLDGGADWLDLLSGLVERDGLVNTQPTSDEGETDYATIAREKLLKAVIYGLGDRYEPMYMAIVENMLNVLLLAKSAQLSVVKECLAVYTGLASEQVIPVLTWANGRVDTFLRQVLTRSVSDPETAAGRGGRSLEGDQFLLQLAEVRRRSEIVLKLELSVEVLQDYLDYGNRKWMTQSDPLAVSLSTFYYLTVLARAFTMSEQPQARLLDYLREVAALPYDPAADPAHGGPSAHALYLVQQAAAARLAVFFAWSAQEVLECAQSISEPLVRNLQQLDLLMRVRRMSARSGMDARTVFLMGKLPASATDGADKTAYQVAAEQALLSLAETTEPALATASNEQNQTAKVTCELIGNNTVIAGKTGETVTYKVTVTDMQNRPMKGVYVHWQATLGTIVEGATTEDGEVSVNFIPGRTLGADTPLFWLDLGEKQPATSVQVIADAGSYRFPPALASEVPTGDVPAGAEVELYAVMQDSYRNLGINAPVNWTLKVSADTGSLATNTDTVAIRFGPTTNSEGLTRAFVSSSTGGTFIFRVLSTSSSTGLDRGPITFLPYTPTP